ncbi:MAG: thermosome subunit beta [Candidatus Ranarchaeia archaeon]
MAQGNGQPVIILKEGSDRSRGRDARSINIMAAKVIAEAVRSSLGPKGMDKMLVDSLGDVTITNDGRTILDEIDVQHPAAKIIVNVAKNQDDEVGDGTTTAVILTGELLSQAGKLIDTGVHPIFVVRGYEKALKKAQKILAEIAIDIDPNNKTQLKQIATTSMYTKIVVNERDFLAEKAVDAVHQIMTGGPSKFKVSLDDVQITKKTGGSITDSTLIQGVIVDKEVVHPEMPKTIKEAKIALIDAALEIEKTEFDAEIKITQPEELEAFKEQETETLKGLVSSIQSSGANVLFCQKGVDDRTQHYLAEAGIMTIRRVKKSDIEKIAKATGAKIVSSVNSIKSKDLGNAGSVAEKTISGDKMVFVEECKKAKAVSVLLRGGTERVVDESERAFHDALSVVKDVVEDQKIVAGGGAVESEIAMRLRDFADTLEGREALAIQAFSDALEIIPSTLAENAGLDQLDIITELRASHEKDNIWFGVNVITNKVTDMLKQKIIEPLRVKEQALKSALEASILILRIDDVIAAKKSAAPPMPPGGMGGMGGMPPGMGM